MFFTDGEEFVGKQPTKEMINGIKYNVVLVVCGIVAGLIPIMLLKFTKLKFLCLYLPMSIIYYFIIMLLCVLFVIDDNFDLINYALVPIPIGSFVGTVVAMAFHYCNNIKYFLVLS